MDYIECVYQQLDTLHGIGARNFVLLNIAPLNHAPEFALPEDGGVINSQYWKNEQDYSTNVYVPLIPYCDLMKVLACMLTTLRKPALL